MFRRFRERFGTAGLVVGVIALVLAVGGTALAASGALTGKQKKEVEKIAKKYAGAPGATGPAGPQGIAGANGKDGASGANGTNGQAGAAGKNVVTTNITTAGLEGHCTGVGGTKFQVEGSATKEYVCNGKNGTDGQTGFTERLPEGKTETGIWGSGLQTPAGRHSFPISFPIPVSAAPEPVIVGPAEESAPGCPGRGGGTFTEGYRPTVPKAEPGKLCIYITAFEHAVIPTEANVGSSEYSGGEWFDETGTSQVGALLEVVCSSSSCVAMGTWAVTAPAE